jgi:hypothetical protein
MPALPHELPGTIGNQLQAPAPGHAAGRQIGVQPAATLRHHIRPMVGMPKCDKTEDCSARKENPADDSSGLDDPGGV